MVPQNLITALPFWDAKEKQTFRAFYCKGVEQIGAIQCRYDRMLPWTIQGHSSAPTYVYLVKQDGSAALNITSLLTTAGLTENGINYRYHSGALDINQAAGVQDYRWVSGAWQANTTKTWSDFVCDGGYYYLEVSFGGTKYYSELMRVVDFPEFSEGPGTNASRVRIEAYSTCLLGDFPAGGTSQKLFIDAATSEPEYVTDREVAKDGNEEESVLWAKVKKVYKVQWLAPETVADFIATLPLYNIVNVTDQNGFQSAVTDVGYKITWTEDGSGCLALVEFTYTVEAITTTWCC